MENSIEHPLATFPANQLKIPEFDTFIMRLRVALEAISRCNWGNPFLHTFYRTIDHAIHTNTKKWD